VSAALGYRVGDTVRVVEDDGFLRKNGLHNGAVVRVSRIIEPYGYNGVLGPFVEVNGIPGGCLPSAFKLASTGGCADGTALAARVKEMADRYARGAGDFGGTGIAGELRALLDAEKPARCPVHYSGPSVPRAHGTRCEKLGAHQGERHSTWHDDAPLSWWTEEEKAVLRAAQR